MTCTRLSGRGFSGIICTTPDFNPGDQAPEGYLAWHEWAEVQYKAGLLQKECGRCGKWKYPQEMSEKIDRHEAKSREGPVTVETAVCLKCMTRNAQGQWTGAALCARSTAPQGCASGGDER